ncbi:MAG TPA: hypothetical protein DCX89_05825 [Saprospirales bacterium]|nr:hypothetical protein [Saprospirales bacterium]HAY71391.1 hypothetical protein [Saprospirales bacterium]
MCFRIKNKKYKIVYQLITILLNIFFMPKVSKFNVSTVKKNKKIIMQQIAQFNLFIKFVSVILFKPGVWVQLVHKM